MSSLQKSKSPFLNTGVDGFPLPQMLMVDQLLRLMNDIHHLTFDCFLVFLEDLQKYKYQCYCCQVMINMVYSHNDYNMQ